MAENRIVVRLDQRLMQEGVIDALIEKDYKKVHDMLNTHVRKSGKILTEETFARGDQALRSWLMLLYKKGATQEKLTSYLRCGLAHLCFDFIESTYASIDADELVTRALVSFKNRGYQKSFFRVSAAEMASLEARKKAAKKKAGSKALASKKSAPSRPAKKKAVKKKAVVKKPVKKKAPAVKKSAVKKGAVKKTPSKKISGARAAVKKTSVKKKSTKKAAPKKVKARPGSGKKASPKKGGKDRKKSGILSRLFR